MAEDLVGLGKMAEAVERGTRELRELVQEFLSPLAKESGEYLADRVRFARVVRLKRALEIAKGQVADSGMEQKSIDPKILAPALEAASLEEDDDLTFHWAGLIATAATTGETLPAYADILRQLTPQEARLLDCLYYADYFPRGEVDLGENGRELEKALRLDKRLPVFMQNLIRLNLIRKNAGWDESHHLPIEEWIRYQWVSLTILGEAFVRACCGPVKAVVERRQ
jgi:hypothetical protein